MFIKEIMHVRQRNYAREGKEETKSLKKIYFFFCFCNFLHFVYFFLTNILVHNHQTMEGIINMLIGPHKLSLHEFLFYTNSLLVHKSKAYIELYIKLK